MSDVFAHGAELSIDLGAIVENWRRLAQQAGTTTAAVVKANAYGCGIEAVVPALAAAGCDTFFVAHLSEGVRARAAARDATIYVLNGLPPTAAAIYGRERLRPVLGSGEDVAAWLAAYPGFAAPAALHVDTGMNRLGFRPEEIGDLPSIWRPSLLMTHFAASEVPKDPMNARQIAAFAAVRARFEGLPASLSNSSGIFLADLTGGQLDLVRPGYALYGGNPTPGRTNPMRTVVRLAARIVQMRHVPAGETIGYNSTWVAPADRRIAVLSLGYADGFLRTGSATNAKPGGRVRINDRICPIVGRVSMDLITVDVTDAGPVRSDDAAFFLDEVLTVDTVADDLGTNGYHVLTSLGPRYRRRLIGP